MQEVISNNNQDADKPHRVFFRSFSNGKITSRIFSNSTQANNFAGSKEVREIVLIQLATDPPPDFKQSSENFNRQRTCRVPCEICKGKNTRLKSESSCVECSGASYRAANNESIVRRRKT